MIDNSFDVCGGHILLLSSDWNNAFQSGSQKRPSCATNHYSRSRRAAATTVSIIKVTEWDLDSVFLKLLLVVPYCIRTDQGPQLKA